MNHGKRWRDAAARIAGLLDAMEVTLSGGRATHADAAFAQWLDMGVGIRENGRVIYLIGNGASASMASHIAADLAKNAHVHTQVFTDLALITAIANDLEYAEVFAEALRRRMAPGDLLVAVSSSGRSENILRAVTETRRLGGSVVTLSAMRPDNPLRSTGDINYYVAADTYGLAETCHAAILHYWMDLMSATVEG